MSPADVDVVDLAARVADGDRQAVAAGLRLIDNRKMRDAAARLLAALPKDRLERSGHLIGITGSPGAGKSTLCSKLIQAWRKQGKRVGVLAVDPSSHRSGGALLGDRIRMLQTHKDDDLFIRSLANRNQLGGLSRESWPMSQVMLAAFDVVLVETVGVGQSEIDVASLTDTTCFIVQPAAGDSIQFTAGVLEIPHLLVVNKADLGDVARRAAQDLRHALPLQSFDEDWTPPIVLASAVTSQGIDEVVAKFAAHRAHLDDAGRLQQVRRGHQASWALRQLKDEFGTHGMEFLGGEEKLRNAWTREVGTSALDQYQGMRRRLLEAFGAAES
ncbi:MAG: methylmalonyl Co-A mutase-associated GTPase MeaB [Deltaproteobacteria bacterium]|nr:methylmalonyl Co-A mutase-associated GTPase MeaB [Deltaproteobacteria bacterium]